MVAPQKRPAHGGADTADTAAANSVRVVARIRPLSKKEYDEGAKEQITYVPKPDEAIPTSVQVVQHVQNQNNKRWFELDAVFGNDSQQEHVYMESGAKNAVCKDLFRGFNCTILAYGQTGSGKTYTMGTAAAAVGGTSDDENEEDENDAAGIIPRACEDLFTTIQNKCDGNAQVTLSYLELYNEEIRDLFAADGSGGNNKKKNPHSPKQTNLKIRETLNGEIYVAGVEKRPVTSPQQIGQYMNEAASKRVVASTAMNAVSSRSHAICTLYITGILNNDDTDGGDGTKDKFTSKLTLVDLAGSERIKKTGSAKGTRQTEGININKSLLVLGQVVSALSEAGTTSHKRKRSSVRKPPYRDSKLTRLLQDSLGGNSRTIMVACVSPACLNIDESINTLRYASTARNIQNQATRNLITNISPEQAAKLQRENQLLKQQILELQQNLLSLQQQQQKADTATTASSSSSSSCRGDDDDDDDDDDNEKEPNDDNEVPQQIETKNNASNDDNKQPQEGKEEMMTPANAVASAPRNDEETSVHHDDDAVYSSSHLCHQNDESHHTSESTSSAAATKSNRVIKALRKQLQAAQEDAAQKAIEIPKLHMEISTLQERLVESEQVVQENEELREALAESKSDAESARMAATYLSDIVDSLKVIKRDEIDQKIQELHQIEKEQHWIAFVHVMLDNYRFQVSELALDFDKRVVQTIDNLEFREDGQDALLQKAVDKERLEKKKIPATTMIRRRLWRGGPSHLMDEDNNNYNNEPILPWKESTTFFKERMKGVEVSIQNEADALKDIQNSLAEVSTKLEMEIGAKRLENEAFFANGKEHDLVNQLTTMLIGPTTSPAPLDDSTDEDDDHNVPADDDDNRLAALSGDDEETTITTTTTELNSASN